MKEILTDMTVVLLFYLLTSCGTKTVYVPVERKTVETVTMKDTVVDVKLEYIRDSITTPDSTSYLSNKYAYSWASVKGGMLAHSLGTWGAKVSAETKYIERTVTDSIPVPYEEKVYEYIEKPLSLWQTVRMGAGDACMLLLAGGALYLCAVFYIKRKNN